MTEDNRWAEEDPLSPDRWTEAIEVSSVTPPIPVGTVVDYHGSHRHGRYVVIEHQEPRPGVEDPEVNYPDGVAYVIWPEGVPIKFGNREQSVVQVRRQSLTVVVF